MNNTDWDQHIDRLARMIGTDEGFFILATQSFIEKYMRDSYPHFNPDFRFTSFKANLSGYRQYLIDNARSLIHGLNSFKRISRQRELTDQVRHLFCTADSGQADIAVFNLLDFCQAVGLESDSLSRLTDHLDHWKDKQSPAELSRELKTARDRLKMSEEKRRQLTRELEEFDRLRKENEHYSARIRLLDSEAVLIKTQADQRKERIGELRRERNEWKLRQREALDRLEGLEEVREYYLDLLKMTLLTTTRLDYERSLIQLTPEQKSVLESISLKENFLIKGGAGTGKTLVLLEALKRINKGTLDIGRQEIHLITYTNTLVKYDRYLSGIMALDNHDISIQTSDSLLNGLFHKTDLGRMDYKAPPAHLDDLSHSKLKKKELKREIEDYIYSNGITREEYIDQMKPRMGMKTRLSQKERKEVWEIKEEYEKIMRDEGEVSKGYSRLLLLDNCPEPQTDYIFIDESQDLTAVELMIYRKLARVSLIMAGDRDQTIYAIQSPYARAGLNLTGRTRILRHNYRNTLPIHTLAEKFRLGAGNGGDNGPDGEISPHAFREGPRPELYLGDRSEELYEQMINKIRAYLNLLGYDRENICILVPENRMLREAGERLEAAGWTWANISDRDFSFDGTPGIRLSTIHSCKGLDLPVTLLFLPRFSLGASGLAEEAVMKQQRNLLYVALTRAMEHLNVFMKRKPGNPLLTELKYLLQNP